MFFFFSSGAHLEATDYRGRSPIMTAACTGHRKVVEFLMEEGARQGRARKVTLGLDTKDRDDRCRSPSPHVSPGPSCTWRPSTTAATSSSWSWGSTRPMTLSTQTIRCLQPFPSLFQYDNTALHAACLHGNSDCVAVLLENQADIDNKNEDEQTPFHLAAK